MSTMLYLDSSALTKNYLNELESAQVAELINSSSPVATSMIAYAEVGAAIARAARDGSIRADAVLALFARLTNDWSLLVGLDVSFKVVQRAAQVAVTYGLRGYDAVHLASALEWQDAIGEQVIFATFDRALHRAATSAGLVAWPEGLGG